MRPLLIISVIVLCSLGSVCAESIRLPVVQDNSIVLVDGEWNENAGQQARIRVKGNQHLIAMSFDTSAIKGKCIRRATLVCTPADQKIAGVTISTIATPWSETRSTGLTAGMDGIGAWGYPDARFPAVCGGNGFTLVSHSLTAMVDGQYHWEVAPDLVHAMAIGIAHGLAIHEHDADYSRNPTIFSREQSGKHPYLLVELDDELEPKPEPASQLKLTMLKSGSIALLLNAPQSGFAYEIRGNGDKLPQHNVPMVTPGSQQMIELLPSRQHFFFEKTSVELNIEVVTLNRQGERSAPVSLQGFGTASLPVQQPEVSISTPVADPVTGVSVIPICDKFDAAGRGVGLLETKDRLANAIYNGQAIRLFAASGEVVGFQMLLRGQQAVDVKVEWESLKPRVDLWQGVYVPADGRQIVDPLVPLVGPISLSADRDEVVVTDIYVPFDQAAGRHAGRVLISDGREIPIELTVLPFALPREATFLCEMNSYGLPDQASDYYALQQIAYDHRVHANILHYSHNTAAPGSRKSNLDMRLPSGRRMDNKRYDQIEPGATSAYWDDFAEAFSPILDGSCFQSGHRGPIAAPGFYLTFHESWPLHCREFFNGNPDAYHAFADPRYAATYVNVLNSFADLAAKREWKRAGMQVYFNNKGSLNDPTKAPWILDEPSSYWDYRALRYYGQLTDQVTRDLANSSGINIRYRIDISRPEFTRGELDGRSDLWVVSSSAFQQYRRLITDRMDRDGLKVWIYGTANHVHEPNRNLQAWALDAWTGGASGLVPWQTVNKSGSAMKEADQLGLFIFDHDEADKPVIRHSLRLKAFREAQQLIEYLTLLKQKKKWNDAQMNAFVSHYVPLKAEVTKIHAEDAGTPDYASVTGHQLERLKKAAATLLVK